MPPLNLLDGLLLSGSAAAVVWGCLRGFSKEMLHTLLFAAAAVALVFYMMQRPGVWQPDAASAAAEALHLAGLMLAAYVGLWLLLRLLRPLVMKDEDNVGLRSRISGGALALVKLIAAGVLLNVWYAAHTPLPHPERLTVLPESLRNATLVQWSDSNWANRIHTALVGQGLLEPQLHETPAELQEDRPSR